MLACSNCVESHATRAHVALGSLFLVASALVIVALQGRVASVTGGLAVPDVSPLYTPGDLYALLEQYGEPGRRAFLGFALFDVLYPFVAYGFAALVLAALIRPGGAARPALTAVVFLPVAGLVVELLEQAGFLLVLFLFPTRLAFVAWAVSGLSLLKLALLLLLVLVMMGLLGWRAWPGVRRLTTGRWSRPA
jgi:hypothetical protein